MKLLRILIDIGRLTVMNKAEIKGLKLKKRANHDVLNCSKCDEITDFCIMPNGDVECPYYGDVKGNI